MKYVLLSLALAPLLAPLPARACWNAKEPRAFVARCPIVVTGSITQIDAGCPTDDPCYDIARITVSAVHKNALKDCPLRPGDVLSVRMAGRNARVKKSTDLRYPLGDTALWLVELDADGVFSLNAHPVQRQPVGDERKVMAGEVVVKKKGGAPAGTHTRAEWMARRKAGKEGAKDIPVKEAPTP